MGGFDILIWVGVIIFWILRAMQGNKKSPTSTSQTSTTPTLQEAIREIEAALRGEPLPSQQPQEPSPAPKKRDPIPELKSSKTSYEPEFHSMESSIPSRELESKTTYTEVYSHKSLESETTYEDSFRTSSYFDDSFRHAHPDTTSKEVTVSNYEKPADKGHPILKRLREKNGLAEAIILQTILTRPTFPPDRK